MGYLCCLFGCADPQAEAFARKIAKLRQGETSITFVSDYPIGGELRRLAEIAQEEGLSVQELNIDYAELTDEGPEHIAKIPNLATVHLYCVGITNEGLAHICKNPSIETLEVYGAQPTDDPGFEGLAEASPSLRSLTLNLGWKPLDERRRSASIEALKGLTQLKSLKLAGKWLRSEDLEALREALPQTEVAEVQNPMY